MKEGKVFMNGRSQAVRIPREYRVKGDRVSFKKIGSVLILIETDKSSWDIFLQSLDMFSDDFSVDRDDSLPQEREGLSFD